MLKNNIRTAGQAIKIMAVGSRFSTWPNICIFMSAFLYKHFLNDLENDILTLGLIQAFYFWCIMANSLQHSCQSIAVGDYYPSNEMLAIFEGRPLEWQTRQLAVSSPGFAQTRTRALWPPFIVWVQVFAFLLAYDLSQISVGDAVRQWPSMCRAQWAWPTFHLIFR